jgi:predicted O-methyltransferase YrrM
MSRGKTRRKTGSDMAVSPPRHGSRPGPIARALAGWQPARVLLAAHQLGVFNVLGTRWLSAKEVAGACGTHPRSTWLLLNACVALGFLDKVKGRYGNSPEGIDLLVRGQPAYLGHALDHQERQWQWWGRLAEAVRTNQSVSDRAGVADDDDAHRGFIRAAHTRALHEGEILTDNLDLTGRKQLFDAGGGAGTYSVFLVRRYPGLKAVVFDLPTTGEIAREVIAESGLQDRITFRAGDYFRDDFGQGNDVVLLSFVLHLMGPQGCKLLLRKSFDSLASGGLVVVHEGLIEPHGMSPVWAALFSLNMLVDTGEGRSYSGRELSALMRAAGFAKPEVRPLPAPVNTSLIIATKP